MTRPTYRELAVELSDTLKRERIRTQAMAELELKEWAREVMDGPYKQAWEELTVTATRFLEELDDDEWARVLKSAGDRHGIPHPF